MVTSLGPSYQPMLPKEALLCRQGQETTLNFIFCLFACLLEFMELLISSSTNDSPQKVFNLGMD